MEIVYLYGSIDLTVDIRFSLVEIGNPYYWTGLTEPEVCSNAPVGAEIRIQGPCLCKARGDR